MDYIDVAGPSRLDLMYKTSISHTHKSMKRQTLVEIRLYGLYRLYRCCLTT